MNATLVPGQSRLITIASLLEYQFSIPPFQRPYDWEARQVGELVTDFGSARSKSSTLFLGLMVLCPDEQDRYAVIDGQQRLTTLMLALAARGGVDRVLRSVNRGLSTPWVTPRAGDTGFLRAVLSGARENEATLSQRRLKSAFAQLAQSDLALEDILSAQVIVYVAPTLAGATSLFERINLRGKDVSQFDLVKNKLIEWAACVTEPQARTQLEQFINQRYDRLYQRLDPSSTADPYDADKLLKLHWILFSEHYVTSTVRVLERVDATLSELHAADQGIAPWIEQYLNSLVEVTEAWVSVERPYTMTPSHYGKGLRQALLGFARLGRDAELQPLIVAALIRWGDSAAGLIRFCEIDSFRSSLARRNSNSNRSVKWRFARSLYQGNWQDARGREIKNAQAGVHQLYWAVSSYWNEEEADALGRTMSEEELNAAVLPHDALDSPRFLHEYRHLVHYLFWNYGTYLPQSAQWGELTREDLTPLQESAWFDSGEFQSWDIEHIYPQHAKDLDTKPGRVHAKEMSAWLDHLGNLTVLPISDNRSWQNDPFGSKLDSMIRQRKLSFNELLAYREYRGNLITGVHWGPNNCRKRVEKIKQAATDIWGTAAIQALGVGAWDARIEDYVDEDDDE